MSHAMEGWLILLALYVCVVLIVVAFRAEGSRIHRKAVEDRRGIAERYIAGLNDERRHLQ